MAKYLLIESRDPYQYAEVEPFYRTASDLAKAGNDVTVFLVQNGVLPARKGAHNNVVEGLRDSSSQVKLLADDFSLRERAISSSDLVDGVTPAEIDQVVDLLADPSTKAVWH